MSDSDTPSFPGDAAGVAGLTGSSGGGALLGPSWQEQDPLLRDLWLQNKTPQEICAVLGRSVAAVMTRAARLGLPRRAAPGRKPGSRRLPGSESQQAGQPRTTTRVARAEGGDASAMPQASTRICLLCLRSFPSQGRHNRICSSCKGSAEYNAAMSLADIHFPV